MSAAAARLAAQPWMQAQATRRVLTALEGGRPPAEPLVRFVGGCVRDALCGRAVKDVDLATSLAPEEAMRRLEAAGIAVVPTGLKHGTVTAISDHRPFEITTLRHDVETFGRHARVAFTDNWQADAARRDLTINALFADRAGAVLDFFGGVADLEAGRVRFVGEARRRIEEDYLRLLRFFRFHAHYGRGAPDAEGLAAATALAPELARISAERKRDELLKLLAAPEPLPVLRTMLAAGVLSQLLPAPGTEDLARLERLLAGRPAGDPLLRLAALLPPGDALPGARALRLSNDEAARLAWLRDPAAEATLLQDRLAFRRTLQAKGREAVIERLDLLEADGIPVSGELRAEAAAWAPGALPLQGADLIAAGLQPGPALGRLLHRVNDWWLGEARRPGRAACLAKARELARE